MTEGQNSAIYVSPIRAEYVTTYKSFIFPTQELQVEAKLPDGTIFSKKDCDKSDEKLADFCTLLEKYSTEDSPEVTGEEFNKLILEFYGSICYELTDKVENQSDEYKVRTKQLIDNINILKPILQDEDSQDGKNLTADEMYKMTEMLLYWQGYEAKTSNRENVLNILISQ